MSALILSLVLFRTGLVRLVMKYCKNLENLILKAAKGHEYDAELAFVLDHYKDDFSASSLTTQLELITTAFASSNEAPTLATVSSYLTYLSTAQRVCFSDVITQLKLVIVIPATNASSECSGSVLRRVKSYLRTVLRCPKFASITC